MNRPILPSSSHPSSGSDRLFLAVFPPESACPQITEAVQQLCVTHQLRGRPLAEERRHVTLHHLGDFAGVPADVVQKAEGACATVAAAMSPFEIQFDQVMSFTGARERKPLVMLENGHSIALVELHRRLAQALEGRGGNRKFRPHLTLLYDQQNVVKELLGQPVRFAVGEIVLVHSLLGQSRYIILGRWPLKGRGGQGSSQDVWQPDLLIPFSH